MGCYLRTFKRETYAYSFKNFTGAQKMEQLLSDLILTGLVQHEICCRISRLDHSRSSDKYLKEQL